MTVRTDATAERNSFEAARECHRSLCEQLRDRDADEAGRQRFLAGVDSLVAALRDLASKLSESTGYDSVKYEWLSRTASEWQSTLESRFQVKRSIRSEIGVVELPETDESVRRFSINEISEFLNARALAQSQSRKLKRLLWKVAEFRDHPMRIHDAIPSTRAETERDWYEACTHFAWLVVQGRVHIAFQIDAAAVEFLEGVWFDDVKRLSAYLQWEKDAAQFNTPHGERYYLDACDALHDMFVDPAIKVSPWHFDSIADWIADRYLADGRVDVYAKPTARRLIEAKAQRLWQQTGCDDPAANWEAAEVFVRSFYENIEAAVQEQDPAAIAAVVRSFRRPGSSREIGCELLNAFEAVVAIFFVTPDAALEAETGVGSYL